MAKSTNRPTDQSRTPRERQTIRRRSTDISVMSLAILFGLLGFALHIFWIVAIVLMALLWGLLVSELGSLRGGGRTSETMKAVVAEAREVKDEVMSGITNTVDPRDPGPREAGTSREPSEPDGAEARDESTKKELYEEAREAGIEGRSNMTKDELRNALEE